uniref:Superoxide dismutase (SOD-1) gene exon 5 and 3' flanking region n=1 Tax=Homo sapiens TaxID=9606 RepID=V9H1B8_HUMAN|nr:unnamed protein product [Homo sapiens]
MITWKICIVL